MAPDQASGADSAVAHRCVFEQAWRAKAAWGAHAMQNPCTCSTGTTPVACPVGERLYLDYMRVGNVANGALRPAPIDGGENGL